MLNRDAEYLAKLRDYYAQHRVLPSFAGVGKLLGLKSTSTVATMVARMKETGHIESSPDRRLQPGKLFFVREVVDSIQAGSPQPANDVMPEAFNIDEHLVKIPSRTVLLRVTGNSMIDAGLLPGDVVVVQKNTPARAGDIVVAVVDQECTIKYLAEDKKGFYLKPGNKRFKDIRPTEALEIVGVVTGSFRIYGTR